MAMTERAVGRALTALGMGRVSTAEALQLLRRAAASMEAAIGTAGGTITITDDIDEPESDV